MIDDYFTGFLKISSKASCLFSHDRLVWGCNLAVPPNFIIEANYKGFAITSVLEYREIILACNFWHNKDLTNLLHLEVAVLMHFNLPSLRFSPDKFLHCHSFDGQSEVVRSYLSYLILEIICVVMVGYVISVKWW